MMNVLSEEQQAEQERAQEAWNHERPRILRGIRRVVYATGAFRVYADGDLFRAQFRWWHPVTWIIWSLLLPVAIIVSAFSSFTVISICSEFSWMPTRYFREHPDRLFYVE